MSWHISEKRTESGKKNTELWSIAWMSETRLKGTKQRKAVNLAESYRRVKYVLSGQDDSHTPESWARPFRKHTQIEIFSWGKSLSCSGRRKSPHIFTVSIWMNFLKAFHQFWRQVPCLPCLRVVSMCTRLLCSILLTWLHWRCLGGICHAGPSPEWGRVLEESPEIKLH